MQKIKNIFSRINPKLRKYILLALLIVFIIFAGSRFMASRKTAGSQIKQTEVSEPTKKEDINKEFTFPIGTIDEKPINMKFSILDASLNNQIVVQGQNATAIRGRTFLIVTIKITNELNQSLKIKTRDYVRLSVNGDENTWLAPEIHNDGDDGKGVEVQAISTKFTRVGFPINTTDKNLVLQIGEIKGNKEKIPLNL